MRDGCGAHSRHRSRAAHHRIRRRSSGVTVRVRLVEAGVVAPRDGGTLEERLRELHAGICDVIAQTAAGSWSSSKSCTRAIAIRATALLMGHARGVLCLAAAQAGVAVHTLGHARVKRALVGSGSARKEQVNAMVTQLLGLRTAPKPERRFRRARARTGLPQRIDAVPAARDVLSDLRIAGRARRRRGDRRGRRSRLRDRAAAVHRREGPERRRAIAVTLEIYCGRSTWTAIRGRFTYYGFTNAIEREFFEALITVASIGPRSAARAFFAPMSAIAGAIDRGDHAFLQDAAGHRPAEGARHRRQAAGQGREVLADPRCAAAAAGGRFPISPTKRWRCCLQLEYKRAEGRGDDSRDARGRFADRRRRTPARGDLPPQSVEGAGMSEPKARKRLLGPDDVATRPGRGSTADASSIRTTRSKTRFTARACGRARSTSTSGRRRSSRICASPSTPLSAAANRSSTCSSTDRRDSERRRWPDSSRASSARTFARPAARRSRSPRISSASLRRSRKATCFSSTRFTASAASSKSFSIRRWRIFKSTSSSIAVRTPRR